MKVCVVNFAEGAWYPRGQARLAKSLIDHGYAGGLLLFKSHTELGCPPHREVPYAFKTYALDRARGAGYDVAIYLDASIYVVRPITPVIDHIARHGYYLEEAGHWAGTWCSDAAMGALKLTRDELMRIPMFSAGCVGFDLHHPVADSFLRQWHQRALERVTFQGPWQNIAHAISHDPRVHGHRHDMTVGSVIAYQLQMSLQPGNTFMAYIGPGYGKPGDRVCFHLAPC